MILLSLQILLCIFIQPILGATLGISWARSVGNVGTKSITVGDTVTWTLTDTSQHTITSTDGAFTSSGTLSGSGSTYSVTFSTAGSYPFRCSIHTMMSGTISVVAATPTATPTTSSPTLSPTLRPTTHSPTKAPTISPTTLPGITLAPSVSGSPTTVPTFTPTSSPTVIPSKSPTALPTLQPTTSPTLTPTSAPTDKLVPFVEMQVISSNSSNPTSWSATIEVREHRHENSRVGFTTRSYCYQNICTYPGPTISLKPGDNFTLTVINNLGSHGSTQTHIHNTIHSPNTTNIHTHGLHISPRVDNVFLQADPGDTLIYNYEIRTDHAPGLHWYHAHYHGSSTLQLMNGLVGALLVEPNPEEFPSSLLQANKVIVVLTRLIFIQETTSGQVSQGCNSETVCDVNSQGPLCKGNETTSPFNPFRVYSLNELSQAAGSTLSINPQFYISSSPEDYVLVNGLYRPTITLIQNSSTILQLLHAHGAGPLLMSLDGTGNDVYGSCLLTILAWDGIYLDERIELLPSQTINLVAAGRVEIEIICNTTGQYSLVENGQIVFYFQVNSPSINDMTYNSVKNEDLSAIIRPWYLQDLQGISENEINSTYSIFITQENFTPNICGFWIGSGPDCSQITPYGTILPNTTDTENCKFQQFPGKRGNNPGKYLENSKLVTYVGAINEWILYGLGSAYHPLHVHVNHMQIISWNSSQEDDAGSYYRQGQWRDTIPPIADSVKFRFYSADYEGETVLHCHFQRHEDLGMMDTYLVMNETAYREYFNGEGSQNNSQHHHHHEKKRMILNLQQTIFIIIIVCVGGGGAVLIGLGIGWFYTSRSKAVLPT